jgi:hypothetical protein
MIVKIFEGDSAKELIENMKENPLTYELDEDHWEKIYRVVRHHTQFD